MVWESIIAAGPTLAQNARRTKPGRTRIRQSGINWYQITALNVKYRDFRYIIPFIVQLGLYVSPVGFLSAIVPEQWRLWYSLNPVVGVIDGFRWCILGQSQLYLPGFLVSICSAAFFLW